MKKFVEKPAQGTAPSNLAIMGRYVLTPEIFDYLKTQKEGAGNEIQLTDAIERIIMITKCMHMTSKANVMTLEKN